MINTQALLLGFQLHTGCSPKQAERSLNRYLRACAAEALRNVTRVTDSNTFIISTERLINACSSIQVGGQRFYVWNEFQRIPGAIFQIPTAIAAGLGSNLTKKNTQAMSKYTLEEIVAATGTDDEQAQLVIEIYRPYSEQFERNEVDNCPIDLASLDNYIRANRAIDRELPQNRAQADTLHRNLAHAQRLRMIAHFNDGIIPQVRSASDYGRTYYVGPNLQNVPKIVRHAALGDCHEYDLESSVFSWKLGQAEHIIKLCQVKGARFPATLEYIDFKDKIRSRLARLLFDRDDNWAIGIVKDAITALGFGAPLRMNGYPKENHYQPSAISTIIRSTEARQRFIDDAWVREFVEEQSLINDMITEFYGVPHEARNDEAMLDRAGRIRRNQLVSYFYQHAETQIMRDIERIMEPCQILLRVHDCIYTRHPVRLVDVRERLAQLSPYTRISHEHHHAYRFDDYDQEVAQHQQRIAEEEAHAAEVFGTHTLPGRRVVSAPAQFNSDDRAWDGGGYNNYQPIDDPFLDGLSETELMEYQRARDRVLPHQGIPDDLRKYLDQR